MTGKDVAYLVLCVLLIAAQVYLDLRIPDYMSAITTEIEMVGGSFDNVVDDGYGMIFCALGSLASSIATGFIAAGLASTLCKRIRAKEFENVERFSEGDMNRFSTASLITRSTNDITQIQLFVAMGLQIIVKAPIMAVWAVLKIAGKSWQWSAITVAAVVAMLVIVACVMYFAIPRFKRIQWMTDGEELDHLADLVRADGTWVYYGVPAENFFIVTWMPDAEAAEAKIAALREEGDCVACCVDLAEEWNFG